MRSDIEAQYQELGWRAFRYLVYENHGSRDHRYYWLRFHQLRDRLFWASAA